MCNVTVIGASRARQPDRHRLVIGGLVTLLVMGATVSAQEKPFAELRRHAAKGAKMSRADAYTVGVDLARLNIGSFLMSPIPTSQVAVDMLASTLADLQMAWQQGKHRGIDEAHLVKELNRQLELNTAAEYLRIKPRELRQIRMQVWMKVPELSTGISRKSKPAKGAGAIFSQKMSPLEAFMVLDWLLYQKLTDEAFLRTATEHQMALSKPSPPRKSGLVAEPFNPRRSEFDAHLRNVALRKWQTVPMVVGTIAEILGGR